MTPAADDGGLPYVDEHAVRVAAPRDVVWAALEHYAATSLHLTGGHPLARVLGTDPPAGFEVAERTPPARLTLAGRHRFSQYRLTFELAAAEGGATELRARTYAAFPGVRGRVYRALVIGSHAHAVAMGRMLRAISRASRDPAPAGRP